MTPHEHQSPGALYQQVIEAVRRHHAPPDVLPEALSDRMWLQVRTAVPRPRAHRRGRLLLAIAAGIAAMLVSVPWWQGRDAVPRIEDARRMELDAGWARLPETTARALKASLFELDETISDLDELLRSDPSNQAVKEMRARFDRQRNAWLESALQHIRSAGV